MNSRLYLHLRVFSLPVRHPGLWEQERIIRFKVHLNSTRQELHPDMVESFNTPAVDLFSEFHGGD
jgi:hypothetical protein